MQTKRLLSVCTIFGMAYSMAHNIWGFVICDANKRQQHYKNINIVPSLCHEYIVEFIHIRN